MVASPRGAGPENKDCFSPPPQPKKLQKPGSHCEGKCFIKCCFPHNNDLTSVPTSSVATVFHPPPGTSLHRPVPSHKGAARHGGYFHFSSFTGNKT